MLFNVCRFLGLCSMLSSAGRRPSAMFFPFGAAERAVPPQNGVGHTTLLGETAHAHAIVCRPRLVARLPESISHTRRLAASPSCSGRPTAKVPLESPSPHLGLARRDLVHRRLPARMFRDGAGLVCRL